MKEPGWLARLQCGARALAAGWLAGVVATIPFEAEVARQYVNGNLHMLPRVLAEGMLVWTVFTLFMALAAWVPFVLPLVLLISPRHILRWRHFLVPVSPLLTVLAMSKRLNLLHAINFRSFAAFSAVYFTAPVIFAAIFALSMTASYMRLMDTRLRGGESRG